IRDDPGAPTARQNPMGQHGAGQGTAGGHLAQADPRTPRSMGRDSDLSVSAEQGHSQWENRNKPSTPRLLMRTDASAWSRTAGPTRGLVVQEAKVVQEALGGSASACEEVC